MKICCKLPFHYAYVIVFCCFLTTAINVGIVMSSAGIFYSPISEDLGVTVGTFGLYMSFNYLASTLFLPLAGRWLERYSARHLMAGSTLVLGLLLWLTAMLTAVWQFYIVGALVGLTMAFHLYLGAPTLIHRWFKQRVGLMIGLCSAASGIGGIVLNPLAAHLIGLYGWRTTYIVFAIFLLAFLTPILYLLLRDSPASQGLVPLGEAPTLHHTAHATGLTYAQATRQPVFYALFGFGLLMIASSTLNLFIPKYLTAEGYTLEQVGLIGSAVMLGVTISKIALGWLNDISALWGVVATCLGGILGLVLLTTSGQTLWCSALGGFLYGWAYAGPFVQTIMLVRSVFGSREHTRIYATISISLAAGGALMSGGWGLIADHTSYTTILSIDIALLALALLIGAYAMYVKRRLNTD